MSSTLLFKDENFAVLGLGTHGINAAQRLLCWGAHVHIFDDNEEMCQRGQNILKGKQQKKGQLICAPFTGSADNAFSALIPSPGIALSHPVIQAFISQNIPVLCDTEILQIAVRRARSAARFVGITGTNGKSTTTALIGHLLKQGEFEVAVGGNLGPSSLSLPLLGSHGIYVIEMSSYMLEIARDLHFNVACLLNLTTDHLQRHKTMEAYLAAKAHIFCHQTECDRAVIGIDDVSCRHMAEILTSQCQIRRTISAQQPQADYYGTARPSPAILHGKARIPINNPALHGTFNRQNVAAAIATTDHFSLSRSDLEAGLAHFKGLAHRQECFAKKDTITFIDDSKATNGISTVQALKEHQNIVWIGGGERKEDGIEKLIPYFDRLRHAYLFGRDRNALAQTLKEHRVPFTTQRTLDEIIPQAIDFAHAHGCKIILFSPACASFDQYKSFAQRGEHFKALVHRYYSADSERKKKHVRT